MIGWGLIGMDLTELIVQWRDSSFKQIRLAEAESAVLQREEKISLPQTTTAD